jgi:hypothetical protein
MSSSARLRSYWLALPLSLASCQLVTGLGDLEVAVDGSGAQSSAGGSSSGSAPGSGGAPDPSCVLGWRDDACRGQCGDTGDGIQVGCGNFMACYVTKTCLPATCSQDIDGPCGINKVQGGTDESLEMAEAVVSCMCYPPP